MSDWAVATNDWAVKDNIPKSTIPKKTGFDKLDADIMAGIKAIPSTAFNIAKALPGQVYASGKQLLTDPYRFGQNTLSGLASGGRGLLNVPENIRNYLVDAEILSQETPSLKIEQAYIPGIGNVDIPKEYDYRKQTGLLDMQKGDELPYALSQFAPNLFSGPAAGALWAVGQNENPITYGLLPTFTKGAGKLAKGAVELAKDIPLTPSGLVAKYHSGNISLKELADNMRAAEGTETPLGDVLKSPKLKKNFENQLANSNAGWEIDQTYKRINEQLQDKADNLLEDRLGKNAPPGDSNVYIKDALQQAQKDHTTIKNNLYNDVTNTALNEGFNLELPKFNEVISDNINNILESPMFLANPKLKTALNELIGAGNLPPTIKGAKFLASTLQTEANALKLPDASSRALKRLYQETADALREDVRTQINEKGSKKLQESFRNAEKYYADEFTQFLDKDLYRLLDEGKDGQTIINDIIKPGKKLDKYTLIEKVQEILPKEQKNILGYSYLKGAVDKNGILQPTLVKRLIKNLGNRQFEALFPDKATRQALLDFQKIHDMNSEAVSFLANPRTGARNTSAINSLKDFLSSLSTGGGIGGSIGGALGGPLGAFLGVTAGTLAKKGVSNATNKYMARILTDPNFRTKVATKIEKRKLKEGTKK